jgi:hypothetical protein
MEARGPDKAAWEELGQDIAKYCQKRIASWFGELVRRLPDRNNINTDTVSVSGNQRKTHRQTSALQQHWPLNLGSHDEFDFNWNENTGVKCWYLYRGFECVQQGHVCYLSYLIRRYLCAY